MRQINPYMAAAHRSGEPELNAAKVRKSNRNAKACLTDTKKYRLHYNDTPVGMVVQARPMEINAWNKNARAFFSWQIELGRDLLPILEWREVGKESGSFVWRVIYRENGKEQERLVSASNKTEARREFESMASVAAVIKSIEADSDVEGSVQAIRKINGEEPEEENE